MKICRKLLPIKSVLKVAEVGMTGGMMSGVIRILMRFCYVNFAKSYWRVFIFTVVRTIH